MANIQKLYSDIDFTFTKRPVIGDVALSYDQQAVIRSVRNLLLTNHFERPFNPQLGSNIDALLFEPSSPLTASLLENDIKTTIQNFEPRARLNEVTVTASADQNAYNVYLSFYIENATLPTTVTLLLERNR
jgi:phage baseplate assembly protein W